jgi:hypothetical protein
MTAGLTLLAGLLMCLAEAPMPGAEATATPDQAAGASPLVLDAQVGPAFLMRSRSRAIGHAFKPVARLGLRFAVTPRLEVGGTVSGVVDASEHYRVLGVLGHARLALWRRPAFSLGAGAALGAGYNADILHTDLNAGAPVVPYGFVALDARWSIAGRALVGVEAGWENLSIVRVGLLVGFHLPGRRDQGAR